jgi:peptidoglycan hydrolase-like protein with peptidoglycan-binding domain
MQCNAMQVMWLQLILKTHNLYFGNVTPQYTEEVQNAVAEFQRRNRMNPTGIADIDVLRLLIETTPDVISQFHFTSVP